MTSYYDSPEKYADNFHAMADVVKRSGVLMLNRGAEIGVRHGIFSEHLLKEFGNLTMWLIDPYTPYMDVGNPFTQEEQDKIYAAAVLRLSGFGPRAVWQKIPSLAAAENFTPGFFDFVFIDAVHEEADVLVDLHAWYPKVRHGGLLAGHDYCMLGVKKAVNAFCRKEGYGVSWSGNPSDIWVIEVR